MRITRNFTTMTSLKDLLGFESSTASKRLAGTTITQAGVSRILELCEALWLHSGNPEDPHAALTHGQCSNGYVDIPRALRYTVVSDILSYHLARAIEDRINQIDMDEDALTRLYASLEWVVGSDHAGATFSHDVARWLGVKHEFTEKSVVNDHKQIWRRLTIRNGESVLQVEDLMTTGGTFMAVRNGIREDNPYPVIFAPVVGVLVHRSNIYTIEGAPVVYLAHYDISVWDPKDCPLCAAGSKRLRPKENWAELTGKS
jgi:orotate phosphoribosyltransferase